MRLSGRCGLPIRLLTALLLTLLAAAPPAFAQTLDLDSILTSIAVTAPARVRFTEERHNPMLKDPLVQSGYLEYLEGGLLRKVVETPFQEAFLVENGKVTVERDGEITVLPVRRSKTLQTMLAGIEGILAGRADSLATIFELRLGGSADDWTLALTPRSRRVARQLSTMQVRGNTQNVTSIRFDLGDGEWQVMDLLPDSAAP